MDVPACAVGRLEAGGPWIGFAPTLDDGYALTVGTADGTLQTPADAADLVALAILYFEDAIIGPPDELAATLGDIGSVVRHAAERVTDADARRRYEEAVDAIDDGLAADVVLSRLGRALGDGVAAVPHLRARVASLVA
jgi:hypothetical protein